MREMAEVRHEEVVRRAAAVQHVPAGQVEQVAAYAVAEHWREVDVSCAGAAVY